MTIKNETKEDAVQYIINKYSSYLLGLNTKDIELFMVDFKKTLNNNDDIKK